MNDTTLIIVAVAILVALLLIFWAWRQRQSKTLQTRFGSEYDRAVEAAGGRRAAEAQLHQTEKRVASYTIRPLTAAEGARFSSRWTQLQGQFVDNPSIAVAHADNLLGEVMSTRGYPVADFDQSAADLSIDHPDVVQNYRAGHDIALKHGRHEASTEDLRQAMIHYRALFDDLTTAGTTTGP